MKRKSAYAVLSLTIALLAALAWPVQARATDVGAFIEAPCPMALPEGVVEGQDVLCGYVTEPEDHATPAGRTIQLAIAIFNAKSSEPATIPLLMLRGGPGESALSAWAPSFASPFGQILLSKRDVILLEQRGTLYSKPSLHCPEAAAVERETVLEGLDEVQAQARRTEALRSCRDHFVSEGIDLGAYTITNNTADVAMVMDALGYGRYDLYGVSNGTILAQRVLREYPGRLRRVILDSVYPITLDPETYGNMPTFVCSAYPLALRQMLADCKGNPACRKAFPDLEATTHELIARFNAHPALLAFKDPKTRQQFEVTVTGDTLLSQMYWAMYNDMAYQLPMMAHLLSTGDADVAFGADMFLPSGESTFSHGMNISMGCSIYPSATASEQDLEGLDAVVYQAAARMQGGGSGRCELWGVPQPDGYSLPEVVSDLPVLLMSGEFDPITPPRNAEVAARYLSRSVSAAFPGLGHETLNSHQCATAVALSFLDHPDASPDTSCVGEMRSGFITEPIAARLVALQNRPPMLRLALLIGSVLLMVSGPVAWLWGAVTGRNRKVRHGQRATRARWFAGAAIVLNLAFLGVVAACNPMAIVFGYPLILRLGMLLPLLSMVPTVAALVYAALAWRDRLW
ncbi:MAG: alpha/beta hydrolase, partial [Anaerolineae bacterium]